MDLSAEHLHHQLDLIAAQGWDGPIAAELLHELRMHVVRPVVRASRLRGPAADQAEASAWGAAWEAIRRPTARAAANPGGMVWSAVRRTVAAEIRAGQRTAASFVDPQTFERVAGSGVFPGGRPRQDSTLVEPVAASICLDLVVDLLVGVGWDRTTVREVIELVADTGSSTGWRTIAAQLKLPAWQVRRVAELVLTIPPEQSLTSMVIRYGTSALDHPAARWAASSTTERWQSGPQPALEQLSLALGPVRSHPKGATEPERADRRVPSRERGSAEKMGGLPG